MKSNLDSKIINLTFQQKNAFKTNFLTKLSGVPPHRFEGLVEILLEKMGYQDVGVTKRTGDGGVDVTGSIVNGITEVKIAIQVKRQINNIGRKVLDELRGSLHRFKATQGVIITTSDFSKPAIKAANELGAAPITLINGSELVDLMVKYKIGVREITHFTLIEDEDFWGKEIDLIEQDTIFQAPQADDLSKIIDLACAIDIGHELVEHVSEHLNIGPRQGLYYTSAAQLLGLISYEDGIIKLSEVGKSLVKSKNSQQRAIIKKEVLSLPLIKEILTFISNQNLKTITIEELTKLIETYANLASTTAARRARTVASWLEWIGYAKRAQDWLILI